MTVVSISLVIVSGLLLLQAASITSADIRSVVFISPGYELKITPRSNCC